MKVWCRPSLPHHGYAEMRRAEEIRGDIIAHLRHTPPQRRSSVEQVEVTEVSRDGCPGGGSVQCGV